MLAPSSPRTGSWVLTLPATSNIWSRTQPYVPLAMPASSLPAQPVQRVREYLFAVFCLKYNNEATFNVLSVCDSECESTNLANVRVASMCDYETSVQTMPVGCKTTSNTFYNMTMFWKRKWGRKREPFCFFCIIFLSTYRQVLWIHWDVILDVMLSPYNHVAQGH